MKYLVTGATGFVGHHLTASLIKDGYEVRALVRNAVQASALKELGVEIREGDLLDRNETRSAVKGCDGVFHLAAQMLKSGVSKSTYFQANVQATQSLITVCQEFSLDRFIHASTAGVYGVIKTPPVSENSPLNPSSAYRESKWRGEQIVTEAYRTHRFPSVIARLPGLSVPGSLNWLGLAQAVAGGSFRTIGDGHNRDHVAYISDVVDALKLCASVPGIEGQCYNIAGEEAPTVNEIIATIAQEVNVPIPKGQLPRAPYRAYNSLSESLYKLAGVELPGVHRYAIFLADKILDLSKAKQELGFTPKVSFTEGMHLTIQWYKEQDLL